MLLKFLILLLLFHQTISFTIVLCNIVGDGMKQKQIGGLNEYLPYMKVNIYFANETILYNEDMNQPIMIKYNNKEGSYTFDKVNAQDWIDKYEIGKNYTCYYQNMDEVYVEFYVLTFEQRIFSVIFLIAMTLVVAICNCLLLAICGMFLLQVLDKYNCQQYFFYIVYKFKRPKEYEEYEEYEAL